MAATNGHHDVVRTLLTHGAQVDALDENSNTALMFAVMQNHPHAVNELLQVKTDDLNLFITTHYHAHFRPELI